MTQVVVTDSHQLVQRYLLLHLRFNGYEVETAFPTLPALAHLRSSPIRKIIILDLSFPHAMQELIHSILTDHDFNQRHAFILTRVSALPSFAQRLSNIYPCLMKPFHSDTLLEAIREAERCISAPLPLSLLSGSL